jgi:hypothetical protein
LPQRLRGKRFQNRVPIRLVVIHGVPSLRVEG